MIATGDHGYLYRCAMQHPADQVGRLPKYDRTNCCRPVSFRRNIQICAAPVGAVHRAALPEDGRITNIRAARCTAPTGECGNFLCRPFPFGPSGTTVPTSSLRYRSESKKRSSRTDAHTGVAIPRGCAACYRPAVGTILPDGPPAIPLKVIAN